MRQVPTQLSDLARQEAGKAWIADLPRLVAETSEQWRLEVGEPFPDSSASLVFPAVLGGNRPVVLKLQFPHRESDHEADALRLWDGDGAVRLIADDADRNALVMERCNPGVHLSTR